MRIFAALLFIVGFFLVTKSVWADCVPPPPPAGYLDCPDSAWFCQTAAECPATVNPTDPPTPAPTSVTPASTVAPTSATNCPPGTRWEPLSNSCVPIPMPTLPSWSGQTCDPASTGACGGGGDWCCTTQYGTSTCQPCDPHSQNPSYPTTVPLPPPTSPPNNSLSAPGTGVEDLEQYNICDQVRSEDRQTCESCIAQDGIWSGLGCLSWSPDQLLQDVVGIVFGIAGGLALLMMGFGALTMATSAGDPKQVQSGREIFTGALAGLLFIIFAVIIVRFIGVDILQLPGL